MNHGLGDTELRVRELAISIILIAFGLGGCVSYPTEITSSHSSSPGLYDSADAFVAQNSEDDSDTFAEEISVFLIHGMGNTPYDFHRDAIEMFAESLTSTSSPPTIETDIVYDVCLGQSHYFLAEARLGDARELNPIERVEETGLFQRPVVERRELTHEGVDAPVMSACNLNSADLRSFAEIRHSNSDESFLGNWVVVDNESADHLSLSRFGLLTRTRVRGMRPGEEIERTVTIYTYWWDGDAAAIQELYVGYDLDALCVPGATNPVNSCGAEPHAHHRSARVNDVIKRSVMNYGLADAAIYLSDFGDLMRSGIRNALCLALMDEQLAAGQLLNVDTITSPCLTLDERTSLGQSISLSFLPEEAIDDLRTSRPFFVLTKSLGSRMFFDALELGDDEGSIFPGAAYVRDEFLSRSPVVYMSANQIPLLGLSDISRSEMIPTKSDDEEPSFLAQFLAPDENACLTGRIVAFYDRNDMLGYRAAEHLPDEVRECVVEIDQDYSPALLRSIVSWIPSNHDQSFVDDSARRLVMCGGESIRTNAGRTEIEPNSEHCW